MEVIELLEKGFKVSLDGRDVIDIPDTGRADLAQLYRLAGFRVGAEIGVEQGVYSEVICRLNPGVKLFCIDSWKAYNDYKETLTQEKMDQFFETTKKRLEGFNVSYIRAFSMEAVDCFEDGSLDFVYIDGNHKYDYAYEDIVAWSKKVKSGGIVSGHDYVRREFPKTQVIQALKKYTTDTGIKPLFIFGRHERIEGEVRDRSRSWAFIKP